MEQDLNPAPFKTKLNEKQMVQVYLVGCLASYSKRELLGQNKNLADFRAFVETAAADIVNFFRKQNE